MTAAQLAAAVREADDRIRDVILRTPIEEVPELGRRIGARVLVKWESAQRTGSFKLRGAVAILRSLSAGERRRGVVTASTGNHGLAMSEACRGVGVPLTLFVPLSIAPVKRDKLRSAGADMVIGGATCEQSEIMARAAAAATGRIYVSPYNDPRIVAGQGTLGLEIAAAVPDADDVLVPVGGGGLAAGMAGLLRAHRPAVRGWGVAPVRSATWPLPWPPAGWSRCPRSRPWPTRWPAALSPARSRSSCAGISWPASSKSRNPPSGPPGAAWRGCTAGRWKGPEPCPWPRS